MPSAKVTSKGQITIPVSVRRALDVESGDFLAFEVKGGYVTITRQDSLEEVSARIRVLTRGRGPAYADDDEAILSAFEVVGPDSPRDELLPQRVTDEDLA